MEYRDDPHAGSGSDAREAWGLQRHLEYRQGELENDFTKLATQINGDNGLKEQLMTLRILADQRHKAMVCVGRWMLGVLSALLIGFAFWFITENWQTRDAVKHLLSRPGISGSQTPGK